MKRIARTPRTIAAELAQQSEDDIPVDYDFASRIVAWQGASGRHALPWQKTHDAYRIWLSEIMLQQTQVVTVIGYYQTFLDTFPTVADLAAAPQEQVMALWAGLGYYTRARNLHRCAQQVMAMHGGVFPVDPEVLVELPGIGRSTAAAIAAFSTGARAAILDGNVKRVLARVFAIEGYPGEKRTEQRMWRLAERLLPDAGMEAYTQGLMDLGATVCTRNRPQCQVCPLNDRCLALAAGRVVELPLRKPSKSVPTRTITMLVCRHDSRFWLEQRPSSGIWGGLMSLPERESILSLTDLLHDIETELPDGFMLDAAVPLTPFTHVFTHYRLVIAPVLVTLSGAADGRLQLAHTTQFLAGRPSGRWIADSALGSAPLPAPVSKLLLALSQLPELVPQITQDEERPQFALSGS